MVRECDCGYLTTTALALKYLFLILPSGCLSFSRVMASKIIPCLLLLSFPSRPYSLIMMRVLIKHEYIRSNIYLIRIPNCLLLLLLLLFSFLLFIKLLAANYYKIKFGRRHKKILYYLKPRIFRYMFLFSCYFVI